MGAHLPILQVVLPLMAAPFCVILRRSEWVWGVTVLVAWGVFAMTSMVVWDVHLNGTINYHIGDWPPPWGIEFRIDLPSAYVLLIVSLIGAVVASYARASVLKEIPEDRIYLFYTNYLLCLTGLLGMSATGDVFNLFVFLEISSLSGYTLIALGSDKRALTASYRYLILGTIGATFYVIGLGLMYMMTGTLNMADLAQRLPEVVETRTILVSLAFLTVGLSLKVALFPLHLWLPNAYTYAPSVVTAFMAATATKVAVYVMIRIFYFVFGGTDVFAEQGVAEAIMGLAIAGMFVASIVAVFQSNLKKMLAYSSVAQIGYIMLGISFVSVTGLSAGMVHLFNHALMKCALFLALGCVFLRIGSVELKDMAGMGRRMPLTMGAFVAGGLSLIGIPLTVGFISKWQLMAAAFEADLWPVAVLIPLSSLIAIIYVWRVVEVAYLKPVPEGAAKLEEAPLSMLIPTWVMALAAFYFGIDTDLTLGVAIDAANSLLGGGQ